MIYTIAIVIVLILDQGLKLWTVSNIALNTGEVPLIDGFVHLTHLHNYGAAFSILQNTRWLLVGLTVVFVVAIIFAMSTERIQSGFGMWTATFLLAGAIGNAIDRVLMGYVIDMFEFEFFSFPVFNVADIFVTCFGILFCVYIVFHKEDDDKQYQPSPEPKKKRLGKKEKTPVSPEHSPSIEDIGRIGIKKPAPPMRKPEPEARPAKTPEVPEDIFAEWEKSAPAVRETYIAPETYNEPAPAPVYAAKPAVSDDSLDLDDILAEFRD